jgi:two-component system KDP operon response regulator KdpE
MLQVLLVEDDRELRQMLRSALEVEGHQVRTAASVAEARALLLHAPVDVVLLDLGLPDGCGDTLLAELRQRRSTPVLVVSAHQSDGRKIDLLDAGADDYLTKPFSIGELLARMRVALRHRGTTLGPSITRYQHDGLDIDLAHHHVHLHGAPLHLTPTEYKLLARLVRSTGQVVTHRTLLTEVWGPEFTEHTHYLRLYMAQLRAKIEADSAEPHFLLTEPGVGYRLADSSTPAAPSVHMRS